MLSISTLFDILVGVVMAWPWSVHVFLWLVKTWLSGKVHLQFLLFFKCCGGVVSWRRVVVGVFI